MNLLSEESGQGVVECVFIASLCAILVVILLKGIGETVIEFFSDTNKGFS